MLEKIKGLKIKGANFTYLTDINLFKGQNDKIEKATLVYGRNGSGKSTISNAFKKLIGENILNIETAFLYDFDSKEVPISEVEDKKIFVFNEDFVNDKVKIQKDGLGSIVMLGEMADLTVKIDDAEKELSKAKKNSEEVKEKINEYQDKNNIKSPFYYEEKMCVSLKKDDGWAGRDRKIKGARRNTNVPKEKYKDFISITASKSKSELLVEFEDLMRNLEIAKQGSEKIIENITKIPDTYKKFNHSDISTLLEETIEKPILSEREEYLLNLVKDEGTHILHDQVNYFNNKGTKYCPFCLQDISEKYKDDLVVRVQSILADLEDEHNRKLESYVLRDLNFEFEPFIKLSSCSKCSDLLDRINRKIQENNRIIRQKINSPYTCTCENITDISSLLYELDQSLKKLDEEKAKYNKQILDTEPIIDRLNSINRQIAYCDIKEDYKSYNTQYNEYEKLKCEEKSADKLVLEKRSIYKELEAKRKKIRIAVNLINKGLEYIFFSKGRLEIIIEDDKYKLLTNGKPVLPSNISIGERNILGLCYFFASILQGKDNKNGFKDEYLIVIDDPVSSFDFENRIGILSFLKLKLSQFLNGNLNSKAIILTHDLLTFFDIEKIFEELNSEFNHFNYKTTFNLFELKNCKLDDFQYKKRHEYTELMKMTYNYAKGEGSENGIVIGNIMRQVLEAFSTFEYKKGISDLSTDKNIINKLDDEYQSYFSNLMYRLILNGGSHREETIRSCKLDFFAVISDDEKVRTAKGILCFMYLLNDLHVIAHLGDVSNELDEWCFNIKS